MNDISLWILWQLERKALDPVQVVFQYIGNSPPVDIYM